MTTGKTLATRPDTLDGKVVGLLDNGKRNADVLLRAVATLLGEKYQLLDVVYVNKGNATRIAPRPIMEELLTKADVLVTAVGD